MMSGGTMAWTSRITKLMSARFPKRSSTTSIPLLPCYPPVVYRKQQTLISNDGADSDPGRSQHLDYTLDIRVRSTKLTVSLHVEA
jgi:hypothetical protein